MWPTAAPWLIRSCLEMSILPLLPRSVWAQINSFPTIPVSVCGPLRELYLFIVKQFSIRSTQANVTNGRERVGDGEITSYFGSGENRKYYYANGTEGPVCVCVFVCLFVFMRVSLAGLGTSVPFLTQQTKLLCGRDTVIERVRLKLSAAAFKELKCYDKGLLSANPLEDRVNETRKEKMHRSRQQ